MSPSRRGSLGAVADHGAGGDFERRVKTRVCVHFHFTPMGASWLNLVEAWFGILTRKPVRRASFAYAKALDRPIQAYIEHWNKHPKLFVWTKEPRPSFESPPARGH